jgi:hypothetical protein
VTEDNGSGEVGAALPRSAGGLLNDRGRATVLEPSTWRCVIRSFNLLFECAPRKFRPGEVMMTERMPLAHLAHCTRQMHGRRCRSYSPLATQLR